MSFRYLVRFFIVIILSIFCISAHAATGRAVSLRAMQSAIKTGSSSEARHLCGITRVSGYLIDPKSKDIILIGEVNPSLPQLQLDDFVVALRSAWMLYTTRRGHTLYYSAPGCSIDPNPKVLRQLQEVGDRLGRSENTDESQKCLDDWVAIGKSPQSVRVMGVPFDTRFAKVMVDADYYMKRLVNGSVELGIPGFKSLSDMSADETKAQIIKNASALIPSQSMSRFWFSPGESTYTEEDGVVMLRSCAVQLLTEEEFLSRQGEIAGYGRPDPLAGKFAKSFSVKYDSIANARSIYKELEGLFRFVALAKLIKQEKGAGTSVSYLLKSYRVQNVPVNRTLPGLTNIKRVDEEIKSEDGSATVSVVEPTCGGVSMDVRPKRIRTTRTAAVKPYSKTASKATGRSTVKTASAPKSTLKHKVLAARKSPASLSWDFELPK